ncbi:MAG: hypothetical protein LUP94_00135 [Candidatus Methanomethylicus sp.]|nr:hypothetical protein [Candidatus Methanomethylicus sp.]
MRVGIAQMASCSYKEKNIQKAIEMIRELSEGGAQLVLLPELFNYLPPRISLEAYKKNAEALDGPTIAKLIDTAKDRGICIIAGSIIEKRASGFSNTSCIVTPQGLGSCYRKMHLFKYGNINEGQVFEAGDEPVVAELSGINVGMTICYDLRFPELYRKEMLAGAEAITNVAAFLKETGRMHWMPLLRARAIENQVYMLAANQASVEGNSPCYYGHSCVIDPWGRIVARADSEENVILADISRNRVREVRERLPALKSIRLI